MEVKEGYKQTEVGVIPEDWEVKQLKDILKLKSGFAFSSMYFSDKGPIVLTPGNFKLDGGLYFNERNTKRFSGSYTSDMKFDFNDLIIVMTDLTPDCNLLGKPAFVDINKTILHNQRIAKIKMINEEVIKEYVYWFFLSKHYLNKIKETATGTTVRHTSNNSVYKTFISHPPTKAEQTAIANALSDADVLIQSLEKLIAKKRAIKQGAMQELLEHKDEWKFKKLGELFDFSGGYTASRDQLSTDGYCYLHYGDIHGSTKTCIDVMNELTEIPKLQIKLKAVARKSMLNDGDVVFVDASEDDEGTSRHIVIKNPNNIPFISGLHTIVAKSKDNSINNDYKRYCFQSSNIKSQFKFYAVGTKVSGISKANIAKIEIHLPSFEEQIATLETKLAKYKQIKQGMMQNLLTGRIRLV